MTKRRNPNSNLASPYPERLREARLARGISIQELADAVGVSRQSISRYELGHGSPSGNIMSQIIDFLNFPPAFFTKDYKPNKPCSTIYFRSLKSALQSARDMLTVRTNWLQNIIDYLEIYVAFPTVNLPEFEKNDSADFWSFDEIEKVAIKTRKHWGLGLGPISNITLLLEKNGVIVVRAQTNSEKTDACSQWRGRRPFIYLSSDKGSAVRSRFDAVHELGHLLLHGGTVAEEQLRDSKVLKELEKEANHFASSFLLPAETFRNEVMGTSLDHFVSLKRRWQVSIAAMIYRCEDLGILSDNQILYLRKQMSHYKMRLREPLDDDIVPEETSLLNQAVELLISNNIVSPVDICDYLQLPVDEIEKLCNLPQGTLMMNDDDGQSRIKLRTV